GRVIDGPPGGSIARAVIAYGHGRWVACCRGSGTRGVAHGERRVGAEKTVVVLGTATPGGGFPVYGAAVADIINETDPTLAVQTRNTTGSTETVPLIDAGPLDHALVPGHGVRKALTVLARSPSKHRIL